MDISSDTFFIGLDIGTSMAKGVLASPAGQLVEEAQVPVTLNQPTPNRYEMDAKEQYVRVSTVVRRLAEKVPSDGRVGALCFASASGNTLISDAEGNPLRPAISWLDRRVAGTLEDLGPWIDPAEVYQVVGWPYIEMFPLAQLAWLRAHEPTLLDSADHVGMVVDYLYRRLTGSWVLDRSTATTFYLQDQERACYYTPFLRGLGVGEEQLPRIKSTGSLVGSLLPEAARDCGLPVSTQVALGCFDHPAAARFVGIQEPGDMLMATGTSWVGYYPGERRDRMLSAGMLVDPYLSPDGPWGGMFSLTAVGTTINDLVARVFGDAEDRFARFEKSAAAAIRGEAGLRIRLFDTNSRPVPVEGPAGRLSVDDFCLGLMESVAFEMRKRAEHYEGFGFPTRRVTMVGGAAKNAVWLQVLSDVLGVAIQVPRGDIAGAMGASMIAAAAYRGRQGVRARAPEGPEIIRVASPDARRRRTYDKAYAQYLQG